MLPSRIANKMSLRCSLPPINASSGSQPSFERSVYLLLPQIQDEYSMSASFVLASEKAMIMLRPGTENTFGLQRNLLAGSTGVVNM